MSHAIESFFAAWGETDANTRKDALRAAVSPDFSYLDPRIDAPVTDFDALAGYVEMYAQYAPGATAAVVNLNDTAGVYRATVAFRMADGKEQLGQYFIEPDAEGRAQRLVGFAGLGEPE